MNPAYTKYEKVCFLRILSIGKDALGICNLRLTGQMGEKISRGPIFEQNWATKG